MATAPAWGSGPHGSGHQPAPPRQPQGPPPICFKCGLQGHFVVNCPQGAQTSAPIHDGQAPAQASHPSYPNGAGGPDGSSSQGAPWPNHQADTHYPGLQSYPAIAPQAPQYQQYHAPAPQAPSYHHPQQAAYQPPSNHSYGPSGVPQGYNHGPQAYGAPAPAPAPQYGNQGYYAPQYSQYPQQGVPPQQGYQGAYQNTQHQYAPPYAAPPYQQDPSSYPPHAGPYQAHQWNHAQPAPYSGPPFQQPNNTYGSQYNHGMKRSGSGRRNQFQSQQSSQEGYGSEGARAPSQTPSIIQHTPTPTYHGNATNLPYAPNSSKTPDGVSGPVVSVTAGAQPNTGPDLNSHEFQPGQDQENKESNPMAQEDLDERFKWEMETIFKEATSTENVLLAQPLSTNFDMTPVPLLHVGPTPSVSRYARKDNVKEFIRPIRSQPQWAYLQEDPAFAETNTDSELIPLYEVHDWMAKRQGIDPGTLYTRKTGRHRNGSPTDDTCIPDQSFSDGGQDTREDQENSKALDHEMPDEGTVQDPGTPVTVPGTPAAPGTPTLDSVDDVWAPQPGEGASSTAVTQDPTEALLASLGVTGSPKPLRKRSAPHLSISTHEFSSRKRPKNMQDSHILPNHSPASNKLHDKSMPNHSAYDNLQSGTPTSGTNLHGNGVSPSSGSPYNNAPYSAIYPHSQFPNGHQYRNALSEVQTPGAYAHQQHGMPQNTHEPQIFHDPWAASHRNNRYGQQRHGKSQHENTAPTHVPYGNSSSTVANGHHRSPGHSASPHGKPHYQPFDTSQGNQSSRRNSWNGNRRGSHGKRLPHGQTDGGDDTPSSPAKTPIFSEGQNSKTSDTNDPDESPLTPTSAEILGKLTHPYGKDSNDKRADETTRRPRRPQPVVEEAYSRRW